MAEHDLRQRVEVSDDDRTVATAEVTTSEGSGGTARVWLRAGPGHITPGRRASLVDAVLDLPEVQESARLQAAFRLGDGESLHRLQERCQDVSTRSAGWSALVDANLPSSRAGTSQGQPARNPCRAHNDVRGDRPVRQPRRRPGQHEAGQHEAGQHIGLQRRQILRRHRRPRHPQISYGCQAQTRASSPSLSQQNERPRRYTFRNPEFTSDNRTRIDRARRPRYWVYRGTGGLRELWGYF
jgi:hypothetical protein